MVEGPGPVKDRLCNMAKETHNLIPRPVRMGLGTRLRGHTESGGPDWNIRRRP